MDNFTGVHNDDIFVQQLTEDNIFSEFLMERKGAFGDDVTLEGEEDDDNYCYESRQHCTKSLALHKDQERCSCPCGGGQ